MLAIIDYGMGNLRSVQKALEINGAEATITQDAAIIAKADKVVLPGVGAINPAMKRLEELRLIAPIKEAISSGKPFLGICLGLQLLFEKSDEGGAISGLGAVAGDVLRFPCLKVPQIGWNQVSIKQTDCPLYKGISDLEYFYFCHSFYVRPKDESCIASTTEYGLQYCSSICKGNLYGVQFHPEKSQVVGLKILENFINL